MINFQGYQIVSMIFKSTTSSIYRGIKKNDRKPVIIKLMHIEYPTPQELSGFIREFEIARQLHGDGIIELYSLEKVNNGLAIVMEDIGGESITSKLKTIDLTIVDKLSLSIQMAECLIQVHQQKIIHKDVNPSNFIWNPENRKVKIIDFGISTELVREANSVTQNGLEGTIAYISPEQTGRINCPVDHRSDLYSLGVILYELFTNKLPFDCSDEADIVYHHIAKTPVSPIENNPEIPSMLSIIVMKLLSKTLEERYQSASGLKKDLECCLEKIKSHKESEPFIPGQNDVIDRFQIPHKLYGRNEEIDYLVSCVEKIAKGSSEVLLIGGYSGIGKSILLNEIRKPITCKKGFFISGKFDQLKRNIPYYAITQAFRGLIRQLLTESEYKLDTWKSKICDALGKNGQIIINIIPELGEIIGSQPLVAELNPVEAQNRFQLIFCEFIKVFAKKEHPLVIFLDDVQWCDLSSLNLLKYTLMRENIPYLLLIEAYRDNEVTDGHPLFDVLDQSNTVSSKMTNSLHKIFLKPLESDDVNNLVADTLKSDPVKTEELSKIIFKKTKGNPLFTNQVLYSLYNQGAFVYNWENKIWDWHLEKVSSIEISDNVVDFLVRHLELLPPDTISLIKLAACIGNQFTLNMVITICENKIDNPGASLWIAIEKEYIIPLDNNYRFVKQNISTKSMEMRFSFCHDRIRQAAYSLNSEEEKAKNHLKTGWELLKNEGSCSNCIFDIVSHLNLGRSLIHELNERMHLSELNFKAGKNAKKSTAFAAACKYFETSEIVITNEEWKTMPRKLFDILIEQASTLLLTGNLLKADETCDRLSEIALSNIDKGAISNIRVLILEFQAKQIDAIEEIRKCLCFFGISLPESPQDIQQKIQEGTMKMQKFLAITPIEEIVNMPEMRDTEKLMAMQLLSQVIPPALQTNPSLYILSSLMMFELTMTYGTTALSCKCIADCGVVPATIGDYVTSYKLGKAAFALINKYKADSQKAPVYFVFTYFSHWREHVKESIEYYDLSYRSGMETGDIQHAAYARAHKVHLLIHIGKNLNECKSEADTAITFLNQSKTAVPLLLARMVLNTINKFQVIPESGKEYEPDVQNTELIATIERIHNLVFLGRFFQYNTYVNIIMNNLEAAEKWNSMAEDVIYQGLSDFPLPDHYLFQALIIVNKWVHVSADEQCKSLEKLLIIQKKMKKWMDNCPSNFAHKYYLVSAVLAIVQKEPLDVIVEYFNKSIDTISNDDFIQLKALSNELQGRFWIERGCETVGNAFVKNAHYLYRKWGAHRKVAQLEKLYPHFFITIDEIQSKTKILHTKTDNAIDVASLLKSTQAISSEIKIERLLTILIRTIIENAGAQHGCLLLKNEKDNEFYIEAQQYEFTDKIDVLQSLNYTSSKCLCKEIVQYVLRTKENIVINNASTEGDFQNNSYIEEHKTKSILCMPVILHNILRGVVYLENNLSGYVFTTDRIEILKTISAQAAISIENAKLYETMEEKVKERTNQLKNANNKLMELSLHDPLTNLHNRRYAYEIINEFASKFIKNKSYARNIDNKRDLSLKNNILGIFLIDIDHFKEVNDSFGHHSGDNVLVTFSNTLSKLIRMDDFIVRWGGEEFLIILNNTKPDYLKMFAKKILQTMQNTPIQISEKQTIFKTCSLGYVEMPLDSEAPELLTLEQAINLSDYALYRAKERGRNCAAHFTVKNQLLSEKLLSECLTGLYKSSDINNDFIKIEFIE
ncbi:MAG: AAA family ATPase [Chitinispirillaceae bacterium]|nr:AAA family ATPase [Chitinispirillaceae bacterium]